MKLVLHHFELPLQHEFRISRESISVQPTLIAELEHDGMKGYGEATTNSYYGMTLESMVRSLAAVRGLIEAHPPDDPPGLWQKLVSRLDRQRFALCAVDQAAWDLYGKLRATPLYRLWGLADLPRPASNYTIGIDSIDVMVAKLLEKPDWPIYKVKLGTDRDQQIVRELRRHLQVADAEHAEPPAEILAAIAARRPVVRTDGKVDATAGAQKLVGDLRAGGARADHQHRAVGQLAGVAVGV